jgi:hypothetical protein
MRGTLLKHGLKFGVNFAEGVATETISQVAFGRDAPMTGKPSMGGGLGSLVVKAFVAAIKQATSPVRVVVASMPSVGGSGSTGGDSKKWLMLGMILAGVVVGAVWYVRKAQSDGASSGETDLNELAGALLADPKLMSAYKHELYKEMRKSGLDDLAIGKAVAEYIKEIRQQAELKDTIPPNVTLIAGSRETMVQRHQ